MWPGYSMFRFTALLARQAPITSPSYKAKDLWIAHNCMHPSIARVNCHTCTYFVLNRPITLLTFHIQEGESFDYNVIVQKFKNFGIPRQNITLLKYKFLTYKQKEGQSFDKFMTQLKKLPSDWKFRELKKFSN